MFWNGIEKIETDRLIDGQKNTHTDRQIDWHTNTDRETDGQTGKQTYRLTHTDRQGNKYFNVKYQKKYLFV